MKRNRLAICDSEQEYAYRLMDALSRKEDFPFEILTFTSAERLRESLSQTPLQLLVIAQSAFRPEMRDWPITRILILLENSEATEPDLPWISKYTSVSRITKRIMEEAASAGSIPFLPAAITGQKACSFLGFYTPVRRCLQTTLAFTAGQLLARKERVLYLNFECYSGLSAMLGRQFDTDFSDLLYHLDDPDEALLSRLYQMTETVNGMELLPPAFSSSDIFRTRQEEWMRLLEVLQTSRYSCVILDLSDSVEGLFEILRLCRTIYTIVKEDRFAQAKLEQYRLLLEKTNCPEVQDKTRLLTLPVFQKLPGDLNHMTASELAHFMERVLTDHESKGICSAQSDTEAEYHDPAGLRAGFF